jgi:hypothetical protein
MQRLLSIAALVLCAKAEYDQCSRPKGTWLAIDQGDGTSASFAITSSSSGKVFGAGYAFGNLSLSSNHITNGATGETVNHEDVVVWHETGSFVGGRYTNAATSQNGMDTT